MIKYYSLHSIFSTSYSSTLYAQASVSLAIMNLYTLIAGKGLYPEYTLHTLRLIVLQGTTEKACLQRVERISRETAAENRARYGLPEGEEALPPATMTCKQNLDEALCIPGVLNVFRLR